MRNMIVARPGTASAFSCACSKSSVNSNVPVADHRSTMPTMKPPSPSFVIQNALSAARAAAGRTSQKPIKRYEQSPASSPKTNTWRNPGASRRPSSGSPTSRVTALSPEQVEAVRLDRPPHAEDCDHDREPHGDFRDGDGDREQREDQPGEVAVEARERDQVDVDGVQHQLDPEQDADRVAAGQDPEETDREHERGQDQIRREPDHSSPRAK